MTYPRDIITPTTTNQNAPMVLIQVLDQALLKASLLNEGWCENVHLGAIVYPSHNHLTVDHAAAVVIVSLVLLVMVASGFPMSIT